MNKIILLACLLVGILTDQEPFAPEWPETFSQEFVQADNRHQIYQSGKMWYDYKNNRQRIDYSGSGFQPHCYALSQDRNIPCSIINVNRGFYINLPQHSKCCKCCTDGDGCSMPKMNWLKHFQYAGQATLNGSNFYKWTFERESYYATQDQETIPRRYEIGSEVQDFIINTYSKNKISESIFQIPSLCDNTHCPRGSGCLPSFQQAQIQIKTEKKALFAKKVFQNLSK